VDTSIGPPGLINSSSSFAIASRGGRDAMAACWSALRVEVL
jgi:hypothetical protein